MFWILAAWAVLFFILGFVGLATLLAVSFTDHELKPKSMGLIISIISFSLIAATVLVALAWMRPE